jgi:hypothetical protein
MERGILRQYKNFLIEDSSQTINRTIYLQNVNFNISLGAAERRKERK